MLVWQVATAPLLPVQGGGIQIAGGLLGGKGFADRFVGHDSFGIGDVLQGQDGRLISQDEGHCSGEEKKSEQNLHLVTGPGA